MIRLYKNNFKKKLCKLICVKHKSTLKTAQDYDVPLKTLEKWITAYNKDNTCYDKKTTSNYKSLYLNDLSRDELIRIIIEKGQEIAKLKRKIKKAKLIKFDFFISLELF